MPGVRVEPIAQPRLDVVMMEHTDTDTLLASLSGTFLQILPKLVTPVGKHGA